MYTLKFAARVQVILLILSLIFSIWYWFLAALAKGLKKFEYLIDMPTVCIYLSIFIGIVFILKLIFLKNNYILPIGGAIVFIWFIIINWIVYLNNDSFHLSIFDYVYFPMLLLLLINSVGYLVMAIKAH